MSAIVADATGAGWLRDKDGNDHQLADAWVECDVRDTIYTGEDETAWVRYRDDGHVVEVHPNTAYRIEYQNDDVIDVRAASPAVDELIIATNLDTLDEGRIDLALMTVSGNAEAIAQVRALFLARTGRVLDDVLKDVLIPSEYERMMEYLR